MGKLVGLIRHIGIPRGINGNGTGLSVSPFLPKIGGQVDEGAPRGVELGNEGIVAPSIGLTGRVLVGKFVEVVYPAT